MAKCLVRNVIGFQYKICYSKINFVFSILISINEIPYDLHDPQFQYKICYSKINEAYAQNSAQMRFQYKICYSKILFLRVFLTLWLNFNTKFVIAKFFFLFLIFLL